MISAIGKKNLEQKVKLGMNRNYKITKKVDKKISRVLK